MPVLPIIAGIGAAAMVVGTVASISNQNKSLKLQQQANQFERQKSDLQFMQQRVQAIRASRQASAGVQQAAENQGVATSSVAQGGQASIQSQMNSNLSFLDQYHYFSDQAADAIGKAQVASSHASMWGQVAQLGAEAFSYAGGTGAFKGKP